MSQTTTPWRERFDEFIATLTATAAQHPNIVGFVGLGSTAHRDRTDDWSDHDFALVTTEGAQDAFRSDLSWLPWSTEIALSVIENHGGMKVIYDNGHVLEYGISSVDQLAHWSANAWTVFYDDHDVTATMESVAAKDLPTGAPDDNRDIRLVLTQLLIGVGRARRGEILSAGASIRAEAVAYLLAVLGRRLPGDVHRLDTLDPRRRFDFVHPAVASRVEAAIRLDPESAARALLDLAVDELATGWESFPHRGVAALKKRLDWS